MTTLKSIALAASTALLLTFSLSSTGCKDKDSCEAVIEHTLKMMPKEFAEAAKKEKSSMVKKCTDEMSAEARKCVLASKDLEGLQACAKKHEK